MMPTTVQVLNCTACCSTALNSTALNPTVPNPAVLRPTLLNPTAMQQTTEHDSDTSKAWYDSELQLYHMHLVLEVAQQIASDRNCPCPRASQNAFLQA